MLAGVIEPPSAKPVIVEDEVVIGANVVVLEGVTVGKGAVVAAGANCNRGCTTEYSRGGYTCKSD